VSIIRQAASYLPEPDREKALKVIFFTAQGMRPTEVAREVGTTVRGVASLRGQMGIGMCRLMKQDGFTDGEIIRSLGIPSAIYQDRYSVDG
jgi:hypothetical protein